MEVHSCNMNRNLLEVVPSLPVHLFGIIQYYKSFHLSFKMFTSHLAIYRNLLLSVMFSDEPNTSRVIQFPGRVNNLIADCIRENNDMK